MHQKAMQASQLVPIALTLLVQLSHPLLHPSFLEVEEAVYLSVLEEHYVK